MDKGFRNDDDMMLPDDMDDGFRNDDDMMLPDDMDEFFASALIKRHR